MIPLRREVLRARRIPPILRAATAALVGAFALIAASRYLGQSSLHIEVDRVHTEVRELVTLCDNGNGVMQRCYWDDRR